jgi:hypothetical protein
VAIDKAWVAVVAALVSACTGNRTNERVQHISEDFGVCANLPEGSTYQLQHRSFDYEIGHMTLLGKKIEVYIGYQPPFQGEPWPRGKEVTNGFVDVERLLLGNKRQPNRGPLFVMFSASDLRSAEPLLREKDFIVDCQQRTR